MAAPDPVRLTPGGLLLGGRRQLLYGGEVQYYRLCRPGERAARREARWAAGLDAALDAGMNCISTYVPWDFHAPRPEVLRFSGEADLPRFLQLCAERGLKVLLKPGPFINSEWPCGVGTFGAVPAWFKRRHPEALARGPDGRPVTTDLLGRPRGRQPSLFSPVFRSAVARWIDGLAPRIAPFVESRTVFGLQLDNETNFYFLDRYAVDHSAPALAYYRHWLRKRYGDLAALDAAYGRRHASFDRVRPPTGPPPRGCGEGERRRHQDWFDAGKDGIADYQAFLRSLWEERSFREPALVFFTNDSPHTFPPGFGRDHLLLWDPKTKSRAGLPLLDAYPKQLPTTTVPADRPFLTAFSSRRFAAAASAYSFAGRPPLGDSKCYSAELQGGLFEVPWLARPLPVPAATTEHVLCQHFGRGSAMALVYVLCGGRNRDRTPYFGNAAVDPRGRRGPRFEVLRRYGRLVATHGVALLESREVLSPVAVGIDSRFDAPIGAEAPLPARILVDVACGAFGWLEDAGLNPAVLDLRSCSEESLASLRLLVLANAEVLAAASAERLVSWVEGGGHLVNLIGRGTLDEFQRGGTGTEHAFARGLLGGGRPLGRPFRRRLRDLRVWLRLPGGASGRLRAGDWVQAYSVTDARPLAFLGGGSSRTLGAPVAWTTPHGAGRVTHFGFSPAAPFATSDWFRAPRADLLRARALARWLAAASRIEPLLWVEDARGTAWARRHPAGAFLFVQSRAARAATLEVRLADRTVLGLPPDRPVRIDSLLDGKSLGALPLAERLSLPLGPYATAVLWLTPEDADRRASSPRPVPGGRASAGR